MLTTPEQILSERDQKLAEVIASCVPTWPAVPTESPIAGLIRIVMAQQVSTKLACQIAERAKSLYPALANPGSDTLLDPACLRVLGLPQKRAECCTEIIRRSDEISAILRSGKTWDEALAGIKGIGPWTISVFRIMVLREPDVLPLGDVGLERAIKNVYGRKRNVERLSERWRPYRSVACWYLWRTLGNEQLG